MKNQLSHYVKPKDVEDVLVWLNENGYLKQQGELEVPTEPGTLFKAKDINSDPDEYSDLFIIGGDGKVHEAGNMSWEHSFFQECFTVTEIRD